MTVNILCTIDVDHDGVSIENERTLLSWHGLEVIPAIKEVLSSSGMKVTWFVRADNQIEKIYGTAAYLLLVHRKLWDDLASSGDEIAWHPHVYRETKKGSFEPETDEGTFAFKLKEIRASLRRERFEYGSVRIGEAVGGNLIMRTLAELRLRVDSSAIPGRKRADSERAFDWGPTPNAPYIVDAGDYRIPAVKNALSLWEVPMTTVEVQTSYDIAPLRRYINLAYHHSIFRRAIDRFLHGLARGEEDAFITTILHPDEILSRHAGHSLYAFSIREVERNLQYLLTAVISSGNDVCSLRIMDVPDRFDSNSVTQRER